MESKDRNYFHSHHRQETASVIKLGLYSSRKWERGDEKLSLQKEMR